jgi:hypothetical protein
MKRPYCGVGYPTSVSNAKMTERRTRLDQCRRAIA